MENTKLLVSRFKKLRISGQTHLFNLNEIPDQEFLDIFDFVSNIVELRGSKTVDEVNDRIRSFVESVTMNSDASGIISECVTFLRKLVPSFGKRTMEECILDPPGLVSLILQYGREEANTILLERERKWTEFLQNRTMEEK